MPHAPLAVVILAAGQGTRMRSAQPKVMHSLAGQPMLWHVLRATRALEPARTVVVVGPGMEAVAALAAPHQAVVQHDRLGTGHAVLQARAALEGFSGDVLIVYGDTPLVTTETLAGLVRSRRETDEAGLAVLGFRPKDPGAYGRLVLDQGGRVERIVEYRDASAGERAIGLCNAGMFCAQSPLLFSLLDEVRADNVKGEYYLTDIVAIARARGIGCAMVEGAAAEVLGVNDRIELSQAEAALQSRLRRAAMAAGVTLTDPASVFLCADTVLGHDVTIGPQTVFGPGVAVADGVTIKGFCHIEGATIGPNAVIGPFARLRPGAALAEDVHVGNFVEIKNAVIEQGAKANHLSYIGDARVGAKANIGAGTITCNYDGFAKHHTDIGAGAFIGSNSALVAPVRVGDGAIVGAGSVITRDVSADALAVARGQQSELPGKAAAFRATRRKK